jgi:hypothetical protein
MLGVENFRLQRSTVNAKHMKFYFLFLVSFLWCSVLKGQNQVTPEFIQKELSKARPYTLVFFLKGKEPENMDEQTAEKNQMIHLQYLFSLKENKHVSVFGPLTDEGTIRGILIFNSTDREVVKKLLDEEPNVKAGYLTYELHPWFGVAGQTLEGK